MSYALQEESQSRSSGEDDHVHHVRSKSNKSTKSQSIDDESQRTTELQAWEPFDRHPTDRSSSSFTNTGNTLHLEDDEKVEMPRSSKPVAPGVIFQGKADIGLMSSECLMLRELLQSQHEDMMIRFDQQQEMLNKIYRTRGSSTTAVPRERRPSIVSSTASMQPSQSRRRSVQQSPRKMPDGVGSNGLLVRVDSPQAIVQSKTKLFSSLTRVDEELRQKAAVVDAEQAKAHRKYTEESEDGSLHFFEAFVANPWFDLFFAIAILTNAIFIGFEVQASIPKFDENAPGEPGVSTINDELAVMLSIFGKAYAGLFFVELCIRVLAQRRSFVSMKNPEWRWNLMDTIIVLASLVEIIFEVSSFASGGEEMSLTGMSGLRTLRIIRITRLVKIARLARILRFVMALRTLTQSILHTLKSLIWAVVLLLLIVYTFAILFTQVVNDHMQDPNSTMTPEEWELGRRYFDSLPKAMLCLYMSIANGVSWEVVIIPLNAVSVVWDFMFLFYIAFATLAVLNVITGVFCQSAIDSAQSDHEMVIQSIMNNKDAHIEKIRMLFSEIDEDASGVITYQMFEKGIRSQDVKTYFESIDLDVWDAWTFFKLLDMDSGGAVEIEEFLMGCLRLRGNAKAMDIAKLCHDQTWLIREQARFWEFVEDELNHLHSVHMQLARAPRY